MKEGAHIAGYSLQRAMENLRWLLEDSRYEQLAGGYKNVNDFLRDTQDAFTLLNIKPEERKQIAELVKELQPKASQRAIGDLMGVDGVTIAKDLGYQRPAEKSAILPENQPEIAEYSAPAIPADDYDPIKDERRKQEKEKKKQEKIDKRQELLDRVDLPIDISMTTGDFRSVLADMPAESIDLIFTDPPYDEKSIPLYGDLAKLGERVLKPGGSLITYVGHYAIGKVFDQMENHLRFWWLISVKHSGGAARLIGKNVFVEWKPLLWFVKEHRRDDVEWVADLIESDVPTKNEHEWQQGYKEAKYYIDKLTMPGDTILDPFAGSGTTLISAFRLRRKSIGVEIDEQRANTARKHIHSECGL